LTLLCNFLQAQDVRLNPKGNGWLRVGQSILGSNEFFDSNGDKVSIRTNFLYTTSLSGEYAVTDRYSVTGYFPFFVRTLINNIQFNQSGQLEPGRVLNSFGDSEVGLRAKISSNSRVQVVGFVKLGLPFGTKTTIGTDSDLQTGDGEFNQLAGMQFLLGLAQYKIFLSSYVAYNNRTKNYSDEIRYGFSVNYCSNNFFAVARLNSLETLFNGTAPVSLNGVFSNHREFVSPGAEVTFRPSSSIGIFTSIDFYPLGRNTFAAADFSIGLQYSIR